MSRGIDHIVHAVRDLGAAAAFYRALGFQVRGPNRHPPEWGTENYVVQLPGTYIELLTVSDERSIAPHVFSFGAFNRGYLARREGLAMLALRGRGADDRDEFRAAGIGDFDLYELLREAKRDDGSTVRLAFTLAFAVNARAPFHAAPITTPIEASSSSA